MNRKIVHINADDCILMNVSQKNYAYISLFISLFISVYIIYTINKDDVNFNVRFNNLTYH